MTQQERDRGRRGDRPSRFDSNETRDRSANRSSKGDLRLFVSNIPYEFKWMDLKDLFREHVGEVTFVELFHDEGNKSRGCGIVEFSNSDCVKKALEVMHRYPINGRKLVLKEDFGSERDQFGVLVKETRDRRRDDRDRGGRDVRGPIGVMNDSDMYNTYGLSAQFLDSIGVQPPLLTRVFVANLEYKVDVKKLKEVFKMAGKVRHIDLSIDKEGNSRGMAVVEYEHPVEAVQAISMFNKHTLYERKMTVRMDREGNLKTDTRLPEGLKTIGLGLGPNGEPLRDIARNLPQNQQKSANVGPSNTNPVIAPGILGAVPSVVNGLGAALGAAAASSNINPVSAALGGGINLQALGLLQSQLLQQGLSVSDLTALSSGAAGLALATGAGDNASQLGSGAAALGFGRSGIGGGGNLDLGGASSNGRLIAAFADDLANRNNASAPYTRKEDFIGKSNSDKTSDMIIVSNIPPSMTWQMLREKFSECGDVKFAELNGNNSGIVRFTREWDAERAIKKFDRTRIDGRTIDVRFY